MKKLLILLSLGTALLMSQSASADHRYGYRGYDGWGYRGGFRHNYRSWNRWNDGWGYRRPGNFVSFSYGRPWGGYWGPYGRGYRRFDTGDFVGGLVVGSLLTNSINSSRDYADRNYDRVVYRSAPVTRTREVRVVNRTAAPAARSSGRRLLRDLEGNCFEISRNSAGDEVRVELLPEQCEF